MPEPWYQDGLHFSCTRCGHCCTGEPGYVWVTDEELAAIAAHRGETLDAVRSLCSSRYLASHPIRPSAEGGVVGLPRNIHKNFQVWREGGEVWLCPTDRVGPVYRLVLEGGSWKFDGLVGLLRSGGRVEPAGEGDAENADFL